MSTSPADPWVVVVQSVRSFRYPTDRLSLACLYPKREDVNPSTTTPRATTAGTTTRTTATTAGAAALDEFPELKDYSDTAFYQLQRALTQRINYIALRASLCIPVGEATAARRAAAARDRCAVLPWSRSPRCFSCAAPPPLLSTACHASGLERRRSRW